MSLHIAVVIETKQRCIFVTCNMTKHKENLRKTWCVRGQEKTGDNSKAIKDKSSGKVEKIYLP